MRDPYIEIDQGPRWVVELMTNPPDMLVAAVWLGIFATAGLALASLARNGGVPTDAAVEMIEIGTIVGCIYAATKASVALLSLSYTGDVLVGFTAGAVVAHAVLWTVDIQHILERWKRVHASISDDVADSSRE